MILARKNGLLIACQIVRETRTFVIVKAESDRGEIKIRKGVTNPTQKLFDNVDSAISWQDGEE